LKWKEGRKELDGREGGRRREGREREGGGERSRKPVPEDELEGMTSQQQEI
jgi:hypothetical protein